MLKTEYLEVTTLKDKDLLIISLKTCYRKTQTMFGGDSTLFIKENGSEVPSQNFKNLWKIEEQTNGNW